MKGMVKGLGNWVREWLKPAQAPFAITSPNPTSPLTAFSRHPDEHQDLGLGSKARARYRGKLGITAKGLNVGGILIL